MCRVLENCGDCSKQDIVRLTEMELQKRGPEDSSPSQDKSP